MKTNHKLKVKLISLGLMCLMVGVFTQCVPSNSDQVGNSNSNSTYNPGTLDPEDQDEGQEINSAQVSEGMKSHEQILHTMSALTGIDIMNTQIQNVYKEVATTLPTDNDLKVFLPPHQLAITKLAAEFCNILVNTGTTVADPLGKPGPASLRSIIWPGFDFTATGTPMTELDSIGRTTLAEQTIDAFWGDIVPNDERDLATAELVTLIGVLLQGENQSSATVAKTVVKGVCTSVLSSAHVTLL